jgi:hypothetical protein
MNKLSRSPLSAGRIAHSGVVMHSKWFSIAALLVTAVALLNVSSCARSQQLIGVSLTPSGGFVFEGYNATGQFTAYGTYIHPPVTKDITNEVVWSLDIENFATLTQTGLITYTRTDGCGSGQVTATWNSKPSDPSAGSVLTASAPVSGPNNGTLSCQ